MVLAVVEMPNGLLVAIVVRFSPEHGSAEIGTAGTTISHPKSNALFAVHPVLPWKVAR